MFSSFICSYLSKMISISQYCLCNLQQSVVWDIGSTLGGVAGSSVRSIAKYITTITAIRIKRGQITQTDTIKASLLFISLLLSSHRSATPPFWSLPNLDDAVCQVRDQRTETLRKNHKCKRLFQRKTIF